MIEKILIDNAFEFNSRIEKLPLSIDINPDKNVNVIVAPNGFGKSTIIQAIKQSLFDHKVSGLHIKFSKSFIENPKEIYFMSPYEINGKSILSHANPMDSKQYNFSVIEGIRRNSLSSGQETNEMLLDFQELAKVDDRIIFLDEPEISMDAIQLLSFKESLKNVKNIQIWIVSHNPIIVLENDFNILNLDDSYLQKFTEIYSLK